MARIDARFAKVGSEKIVPTAARQTREVSR
jgi:hypothetical protein